MHRFIREQVQFITENIKGRTTLELLEMFNRHFELQLGLNQVRAFIKNHGLSSGLNCRFSSGHVPANKGQKGISYPGMKHTQFKKGNKSHNWVPLDSERITKDGYIQVKIDDGKFQHNWKGKHILVWEAANGPVPKGSVVIFGDGDKQNLEPDNLILVSRKQLVRLNQHNLIQDDAELTRTGIIIADIHNKIGERKKVRRNDLLNMDETQQ